MNERVKVIDTDETYLALVPSAYITTVWIRILPHLMKSKEFWGDYYSEEDIRVNLISDRQQLWLMIDKGATIGVVLTQLEHYPEMIAVKILLLAGDGMRRQMILDNMPMIEQWARGKGAKMVDILGREEWFPLLKKMDYKSPGRLYRKVL